MGMWKTFVIIFGCGLIGIILGIMELALYTEGIFLDELIVGTVSITDLVSLTVVIWLIIGVVIAAIEQ